MVRKGVSCSIILILLAGSGAFGNLLQDQGMNIGSINQIQLLQGDQSGQSTQNFTIDMSQVGDGSSYTVANVHLSSGTSPLGGLLGASNLFGIGGLGSQSLLGTSSLLGTQSLLGMPSVWGMGSMTPSTGSLQMALLRARLLGQF
ncbi:MAG: hypothetical protein QM570_15075 [Planctomycetota bacterium]|nr:hypothetical protein [Planctomycetota bacterium]